MRKFLLLLVFILPLLGFASGDMSAEITQLTYRSVTGTVPFDDVTDEEGRDSGPDNNVIRSFDSLFVEVNYAYEQKAGHTGGLNNGSLVLEFKGPNVDWFSWDIAHIKNVLGSSDVAEVVEGDYKVLKAVAPLPQDQSAQGSMGLKADIGKVLIEEFELSGNVYFNGAPDTVYEFEPAMFKTTVGSRLSTMLARDDHKSRNLIIDGVSGRVNGFSHQIRQLNPVSYNDTRGIDYFLKDIKSRYRVQVFYIADNGSGKRTEITDLINPQIIDMSLDHGEPVGEYYILNSSLQSNRYVSLGYINSYNEQRNHQGSFTHEGLLTNNVTVDYSNFDLNNTHQSFNYGASSDQLINPAYDRPYEYGILGMNVLTFTPNPTEAQLRSRGLATTNFRLQTVITADNIKSTDGKDVESDFPQVSTSVLFDVYGPGSMTKNFFFSEISPNRSQYEFSAKPTYYSQDVEYLRGKETALYFQFRTTARQVMDYSHITYITFDGDGFELLSDSELPTDIGPATRRHIESNHFSMTKGKPEMYEGVSRAYGVKKDGSTWVSDAERNTPPEELQTMLNWYSTIEEAREHGLIVAYSYYMPNLYYDPYTIGVSIVDFSHRDYTRVRDTAEIGGLYSFTGGVIAFSEKRDDTVHPFLTGADIVENRSLTLIGNKYTKHLRLEDGSLDPMTGAGGYKEGATALIVAAEISNTLEVLAPDSREVPDVINFSQETGSWFRVQPEIDTNEYMGEEKETTFYLTLPETVYPDKFIYGGEFNSAANKIDNGDEINFLRDSVSEDGRVVYKVTLPTKITKESFEKPFYMYANFDLGLKNLSNLMLSSTIENKYLSETTPERRTSTESVAIVNPLILATSKFIEPQVIEHANTNDENTKFRFRTIVYNNQELAVNNIDILDYLPKSGEFGSLFSGDYKVENISLSPYKEAYVTTDDGVYNIDATDLSSVNWSNYNNSLDNMTGLHIVADIPGSSQYVIEYDVVPDKGALAGDKYRAKASIYNPNSNIYLTTDFVEGSIARRNISGLAFLDNNQNGLRDVGEGVLKDVAVALLRDGSVYKETVTDENGRYMFTDVLGGDYTIQFFGGSLPEGLYLTDINVGDDDTIDSDANPDTLTTDLFSLSAIEEVYLLDNSTQNVENIDIGVYYSEVVFEKLDSLGERLPGATIAVYDTDDNLIERFTMLDGIYSVTGMVPGEYYYVEEQSPEGYDLLPSRVSFTVSGIDDYVMIINFPQGSIPAGSLPRTGGSLLLLPVVGLVAIGLSKKRRG